MPVLSPASLPYVLTLIALAVGLVLALVPRREGLIVAGAAGVAYTLYQGYGRGWDFSNEAIARMILVAVLVAVGLSLENLSYKLGPTRYLSQQTTWGALIGAIVAIFLTGSLLILVAGLFLGAMIAELTHRAPVQEAARTGMGALMKLLGPDAIRLFLALSVIGAYVGRGGI